MHLITIVTAGDDMTAITTLMQDMQAFGNPPQELIDEVPAFGSAGGPNLADLDKSMPDACKQQ